MGKLTVGSNPTSSAMSSHDDLEITAMRLALEEARGCGERGEVPVGAVVIVDGEIIAQAGNEREALHDPTAHAEVLALRAASAQLGSWRLEDATLVVTLEPCVMCAGALLNARVGRVVIGAMDLKAGALGSRYNVGSDPRLNHEMDITVGVLANESAELIQDFFAQRR